jgi:hypothetical protein
MWARIKECGVGRQSLQSHLVTIFPYETGTWVRGGSSAFAAPTMCKSLGLHVIRLVSRVDSRGA